GTAHFQPSNLEPTSIDVGNQATNVIPPDARAAFNVRFNDRFTGQSLESLLRSKLDGAGVDYELAVQLTGEAFLTEPGSLSEAVAEACRSVVGTTPELSTSGGTSDARFIHRACPVIEFGLVSRTMHKTDEHVPLADLTALTEIYRAVLAVDLGEGCKVGERHMLVGLEHGAAHQPELDDGTGAVDEARIRGAARGAELGRGSDHAAAGLGHRLAQRSGLGEEGFAGELHRELVIDPGRIELAA